MILTKQVSVSILSALLFSTVGCSGLTDQPKPDSTEQKPLIPPETRPPLSSFENKSSGAEARTLLDRYELREIRNGNYVGTALLDKQTGRVWTLEVATKGQEAAMSFVEVPINPRPEATATQAGWVWNPKTGRYEPPKNPY